jgi:hypothetical protein
LSSTCFVSYRPLFANLITDKFLSTAQNQEIADLALDFSSFLLRYNRELDYQDFSDDATILQKIKKAETYRTWADIEDLANSLSTLQTQVSE